MKTYRIQLLVWLLCLGSVVTAVAQNSLRFKDYPITEFYKGRNADLKLTKEDRVFRTRLKWAADNLKPNFAGRYIVTSWGCGSGCIMGAAIDAKTGRVSWWGFSLCCWSGGEKLNPQELEVRGNIVEFRKDSRLIVFSGIRNEKTGDHGVHYYKLENGRFVHLRTNLVRERD